MYLYPKNSDARAQSNTVPDSLYVSDKIKVLRPQVDEGPVLKLTTAPGLLQKKDPEFFLITLDDDEAYSRAMVFEMIYAVSHVPGAVLSGKGQMYDYYGIRDYPKSPGQKSNRLKFGSLALKPIDVVAGFATLGYPVVHQLFYGYGGDALHRGAGVATSVALSNVNNLKYQKTFDLIKSDVF